MPRPIRHNFTGSDGHRLAAILDLPDEKPKGYALFAHCFTCTKDLKAAHWLGRELADQGIAMLRFDFAGLGQSEGEFDRTSLSSNIEDLLAAANYMRTEHSAPQLMIGHSLGGCATLAAARRVPECRAVCTIASALEPSHLRQHLVDCEDCQLPELFDVEIGGRQLQLRPEFLADLEQHDAVENIRDLGRALLVLHAPGDDLVEMEQGERIFATAAQPKSFIALDGADHLLSQRKQAQRAAQLIALWAAPYVGG